MIRDARLFEEWESKWLAEHPLDLEAKLRLLDGMYELARQMGAFPPKDPLEGIDVDIRLARALNVRPDP